MPIPQIIDPITLRAILAQELPILDLAATLLNQQDEDSEDFPLEISEHAGIIAHLNEAVFAHESNHPEDQFIHACLMQVKAWHLIRLDFLTTIPCR